MNLRKTLLVPLVLAVGACGRQDAAPFVAPDIEAFQKSTGAVKIAVLRDTAVSRTVPKFVTAGGTAANGQVQVELVKANDPTFIAGRASTDATGNILITGVAPGDYLLRPVLRAQSTSLVPAGGLPVTVVAGDTVTPDTVRVRVSTRVAGTVATEFLDSVRFNSRRHGGLTLQVFRETGNATNVYTLDQTVVTNGVGVFEFFVTPGPERVRIKYNSVDITNFVTGTTLSGNAPVPYIPRPDSVTVTGVTPGRDITQNVQFNYPTRLTGIVYRDRNANGVRDSLPVSNPKEALIGGDTVVIQLRDSADTKVIRTATVSTATTTANNAVNSFTFTPNVAPGRYVLRLDKLASRFTSNPLEFVKGPAYEVFIAAPTTGVVNATCRPFGSASTVAFGNCNFGLVSGQ